MLKPFPADRATKPPATRAIDLILRKRTGGELSTEQIRYFVEAVVANGNTRDHPRRRASDRNPWTPFITDAQLGALLMAILLHGLTPRELANLTDAMSLSGELFDPSLLETTLVDKHSTGGVGDKTSLLVTPIVASAGLAHPTPNQVPSPCVPMISGRSLGHTGGTLDKLESIPGFTTSVSLDRLAGLLRARGAAIIGQTPDLVPADRLLYAMRDHTGTVESPFLIAASIMSKKLAESLDGLVLDVKVGSGALMPSHAASRLLADLMVEAGTTAGTRTVAILSSMDQPLGRFAGNWLEVAEATEILAGRAHPLSADLIDLSLTLAGHMLHLGGRAESPSWGRSLAEQLLSSGAAHSAWLGIVEAQGGDIAVLDDPFTHHRPRASRTVHADRDGFLASVDCAEVGWAVQRLGAGRLRPDDPVSAHAGIEMHHKLGDPIHAGDPLITLFTEDPLLLAEPEAMLRAALAISPTAPSAPAPLIHEIITPSVPRN